MMPSLDEYLLVEETPVEIEGYRRLANGRWEIDVIRDEQAIIQLESVGCDLPVAEVYSDLHRL